MLVADYGMKSRHSLNCMDFGARTILDCSQPSVNAIIKLKAGNEGKELMVANRSTV
jgi:hypothetical protein